MILVLNYVQLTDNAVRSKFREKGVVFREIDTKSSIRDFGYRNRETIQAKETLPQGINFLTVELSGGNGAWKGQIGSVSIFRRPAKRDSSLIFYLDSENGSDLNSGLSPDKAWKSLEKINQTELIPGDSVLLKSGAFFLGSLKPQGTGSESQAIIFGKYGGTALPVINSAGFLAGIQIENQSNIIVSDLEITSDAWESWETKALQQRFGVNIISTQIGEFKNITLKNLNIHHIFATENVESDGQNPT